MRHSRFALHGQGLLGQGLAGVQSRYPGIQGVLGLGGVGRWRGQGSDRQREKVAQCGYNVPFCT